MNVIYKPKMHSILFSSQILPNAIIIIVITGFITRQANSCHTCQCSASIYFHYKISRCSTHATVESFLTPFLFTLSDALNLTLEIYKCITNFFLLQSRLHRPPAYATQTDVSSDLHTSVLLSVTSFLCCK